MTNIPEIDDRPANIVPRQGGPVPATASPAPPLSRDIVKMIATDIGKEVAAYIEVMYPDAVKACSSTFLLSVRNSTYNEIMGALETIDEQEILARLEERRVFRRKWKAQWKKLRGAREKR